MFKILVADDDHAIQGLIMALLAAEGFEVIGASDGSEAVALAESQRPRLIIMDISMPRMTGYEATRKIRALPDGEKFIILGLTANDHQGDYDEAYKAGCDGFMSKPFQPQALVERVMEMCNTKSH
jgi:two-component system cell cycle response regulator DivK